MRLVPNTTDMSVSIPHDAPSLISKHPYCPYCSDGVVRYSKRRHKFLCDLCKKHVLITDEYGNPIEVKE